MSLLLARIISIALNPLAVIVFLPFFIVYRSTHDFSTAVYWTLYTLVFLLALALFVVLSVKKGKFTDFDVSKREQRPALFHIAIVLGALYLVGLFLFRAPFILAFITCGVILGTFLISMVNKRVKASVHVATVAALLIAVAIVYGGQSLWLLLIVPLVAWARVTAKRHTPAEAFTGGLLGSLLSLALYMGVKLFLHK